MFIFSEQTLLKAGPFAFSVEKSTLAWKKYTTANVMPSNKVIVKVKTAMEIKAVLLELLNNQNQIDHSFYPGWFNDPIPKGYFDNFKMEQIQNT